MLCIAFLMHGSAIVEVDIVCHIGASAHCVSCASRSPGRIVRCNSECATDNRSLLTSHTKELPRPSATRYGAIYASVRYNFVFSSPGVSATWCGTPSTPAFSMLW